jgi:hypothetical protein
MIVYKHTQVGHFIIFMLIIGIAVVIPALIFSDQIFLIPFMIIAIFVIGGLFWTLTIEVTDLNLKFWFGIGLIHKSVLVADIATFTETRTSVFSGWGIHLTLRGWLYNISGLNAIEINLKNGKRFLLGTDEPQALCNALKKVQEISRKTV